MGDILVYQQDIHHGQWDKPKYVTSSSHRDEGYD